MKAAMNGVLNLSVDDGWVPEAEAGEVPWKIGIGTNSFCNEDMDWLHSRELYAYLELEVFPEFWERNVKNIPTQWVRKMKMSISSSLPNFSAQRMVREYAQILLK
jgi:starch phosphorylase